jgi:hypothetical protein
MKLTIFNFRKKLIYSSSFFFFFFFFPVIFVKSHRFFFFFFFFLIYIYVYNKKTIHEILTNNKIYKNLLKIFSLSLIANII